MKDLCKACEAAVVAGTVQADPVLAKHVAECPRCRDFAEFEALVRHAEPVLPKSTPDLAAILAEKARRDAAQRRRVHLLYLPLSLAAAAALAVAGLTFTLPGEAPVAPTVNVASADGWIAGETLTESWSNQSLDLAWDAASECETSCRASLAVLRQDANAWSIEAFNPIEEDWEI